MACGTYSFAGYVSRKLIMGTLLLVFAALPLHGHAHTETSHVTKECLCWIFNRAEIESAASTSLSVPIGQSPYRHQAEGYDYVTYVSSFFAIRAPPQIL